LRAKSVRDDRSMLDNIVLPKLGAQKVTGIGRWEIEALHAAMWDRPYQANRVLALLSKMFSRPVGGLTVQQPSPGRPALNRSALCGQRADAGSHK
jgi:hypothetical protein